MGDLYRRLGEAVKRVSERLQDASQLVTHVLLRAASFTLPSESPMTAKAGARTARPRCRRASTPRGRRNAADDLPDEIALRGQGGTDFRPGFEWLDEQGLRPGVCYYFTDME